MGLAVEPQLKRIAKIATVGDARRGIEAAVVDLTATIARAVSGIPLLSGQRGNVEKRLAGYRAKLLGMRPHFARDSKTHLGAATVAEVRRVLNSAYIEIAGAHGLSDAGAGISLTAYALDEILAVTADPSLAVRRTTKFAGDAAKVAASGVGDLVDSALDAASSIIPWKKIMIIVGGVLVVVGLVLYVAVRSTGSVAGAAAAAKAAVS